MLHRLKVLIVDDSDLTRFSLGKMLRNLKVEDIVYAVNGEQAFSKLSESTKNDKDDDFDLILLDWNMPVVTGISFLKKLQDQKEAGKFKDVQVIMVTAESSMSQVLQALSTGAAEYIVKPVRIEVLKRKVTNLFFESAKEAG